MFVIKIIKKNLIFGRNCEIDFRLDSRTTVNYKWLSDGVCALLNRNKNGRIIKTSYKVTQIIDVIAGPRNSINTQ